MGRIKSDRSSIEVINPEGAKQARRIKELREIPQQERTKEETKELRELTDALYPPVMYGYTDSLLKKYFPSYWCSQDHMAYLNHFHMTIIDNLWKYDGTTQMTTFINMFVFSVTTAIANESGISQGSNSILTKIKKIQKHLENEGISEEDITTDILRDYLGNVSAATIDGALRAGEIAAPTCFNPEIETETEGYFDTPEAAYERTQKEKELADLMNSIPSLYSAIVAAKTGYDYKSDKGRDYATIGRDADIIELVKESDLYFYLREDEQGEYIDKTDIGRLYDSGLSMLKGLAAPKQKIMQAIDNYNIAQSEQELYCREEASNCQNCLMADEVVANLSSGMLSQVMGLV